jgi:DNA-binding NtrC family response regulator
MTAGSAAAAPPVVLVVDPDPQVRDVLVDILADLGLRAVTAAALADARAVAAREPVRLAFIEMLLPDGSGATLAAELAQKGCAQRIMCGHPDVVRSLGGDPARFLAKPFRRSDIVRICVLELPPWQTP